MHKGMTDAEIGAYNQIYLLALLTKQGANGGSSQQVQSIDLSTTVNTEGEAAVFDEKYGAFHFLKTLPITLPLRSKQEVSDAHDKLKDPAVMEEMAGALVRVVETARVLECKKRKKGNTNSLLCNAIISRFDLPYFITVFDVRQHKEAPWYLNKLERLPLGKCHRLKKLYECALRKLGKESLVDKKG